MKVAQRKNWQIACAAAFTVIHYVLTAYIFLLTAAYASNIDGKNPPLTALQSSLLMKAFYVMLFPFGLLPFGVLFNSAILGYGVYRFLIWRFPLGEASHAVADIAPQS